MRIKIIGENNCARATRNLLRQAGFAVTEFLSSEVITQAPHSGYAITIDLAPAPHTPDPTSKPDHSTHGQPAPANGEASPADGGASSPTALCEAGGIGAQADASATGRIHFDSVDCALEAAILRHVTQLAVTPVVLDRPGGVVHSERELRIVIPRRGNAKADEAAAVAVEFGVLRGLLDLTSPPAHAVSEDKASQSTSRGRKKWWTFGIVLLTGALLALTGSLQASPHVAENARRERRVVEERGADGAFLHLEAALAPAQGQFGAGQMNLALIGGEAVSSSLYDSGNTALKVNCVVGCGAASGFSDNAAFTAGSTSVNNISAVFNDSITALTGGNAGALRSTSDRMLYVNLGRLGGTALSGANVVDSGNTAFRVNCVVGCSSSGGFTDNSTFTAGMTSETNAGGVFNDGLATLSSGNAAAARITAYRALHVNLRNASGTEIGTATNPVRTDPTGTTTQPVSGTFWQATQPVSIATMPTTPVTGTFWQTTQPVSESTLDGAISSGKVQVNVTNSSLPVTGTFWQATQPVSGTFWQATQPVSSADGGLTTLGTTTDTANSSTTTTAATVVGILKEISKEVQSPPSTPVTGTFWQATQPVSGTFWQTTQPVSCTAANCATELSDGSHTETITAASTSPASSATAANVAISPNTIGCAGQSLANTASVAISASSSGENQLLSGSSGKSIYVCHFDFIATTAVTAQFMQASSGTCSTTTAMTGAYPAAANGGISSGNGQGVLFTVASGDQLCINLGGSVQTSGLVTYAQVPAP